MRKNMGVMVGIAPLSMFGGMTANERRLGRFIRDGEGHPAGFGGGDSGQQQNNGDGNTTAGGNQSQNQNNSGQQFDPAGFWSDPANQQGQNGSQNQSQNNEPNDDEFSSTLINDIRGFAPPTIFDSDIATQIGEGNLEGVNQRMQQYGQNVLQQSMVLMARILQRFEGQIDQRISGAITSNSTQQNDTQLLEKNFPTYSRPEVRPVIQGVFAQSLKHTGGDRNKALEMTRGMLRSMGQLGGEDFGIPPSNPDDSTSSGPSSLVQELLSMR